jgi:hypothetical protein
MEVEHMQTVETLADVPKGCSVMEVMDHTGDTKKIWDPTKPVEVEDARRSFEELRKKGYAAFSVSEDGTAGEQLTEFDPNAGRVIMRPPMAGG